MPFAHTIERLDVTRTSTGATAELVVHRLTGDRPGPTLVMFGGIHGDEAMGVEAVRRVLTSLEGAELSGTVVAVPVANPFSFETMTRHTVQDGLNLNRIFPGDAGGSITEQLAAALVGVLEGADHFIDFHSSGLYSTVDYAYLHENGREMAEAYGTPLLYHHDSYSGSATAWALEHGIGAMVSELGGGGQLTARFLDRAVTGATNVLRALGMLTGEVSPAAAEQVVMTALVTLRPSNGGTLLSDFGPEHLGERIPQGTVLGTVVDAGTFEVLETLRAPFDPSILVLTRESTSRVAPGDYGFMVGDGATTSTVAEELAG